MLASSVQSRRIVPAAEEPLQMVGQQLFEALFTGQVYGAYRASLGAAQASGTRTRAPMYSDSLSAQPGQETRNRDFPHIAKPGPRPLGS